VIYKGWFAFGIYFLLTCLLLTGALVYDFNPYLFYQPGFRIVAGGYRMLGQTVGTAVDALRSRGRLMSELQDLRGEREQLARSVEELTVYREDSRQLRRQLELPPVPSGFPVAVESVSQNLSLLERTTYLNKGYRQGLREGQPLLEVGSDNNWLLRGKLKRVYADHSLAVISGDPRFTVGVKIEGIPDRQFVLKGSGSGDMVVEEFPEVLEVEPGARVYSAQASLIAPPDVLVGRVREVVEVDAADRAGKNLFVEAPPLENLPSFGWVLVGHD